MIAIFNTSPLIFLDKLSYLEKSLTLFQSVIIPKNVLNEIYIKDDNVKKDIIALKNQQNVISDLVILDDYAARRIAIELGLEVKGTLGILKKLMENREIEIHDMNMFYNKLIDVKFRVRKSIFEKIFTLKKDSE